MADALAPLGAPKFATSQQLADDIATKEQLQSTRDYAKALLMGSGQQPVHHWTQGVSNMVSALMGGMLDYNAAQKEKAGMADFAHKYMPADPNAPQGTAPTGMPAQRTSFDDAPPSGGHQTAEGGLSPEIDKYITDAAQKYGVDPAYLRKTAMIESSGNPRDVNPRSGAAGLFQFVHGTANQYGLKDPLDPAANTDAAARFTADNMKQLTQALGRPPTPGELYLAHQQGVGGAIKLLTNPGAPAVSSVGLGAVMNNGGAKSMTGQQFANMWTSRFPGAAPVALPNSGSIQPAMNLTSSAQPNAAQTTAAVLRGDEQPQAEPVAQRGATPGITQALPQPQGGQQPIVPPELVPHPPRWTPQQFRRGIVNDYLPEAVKGAMLNGYLTQNQPVKVPVTGGNVIVNPNYPTVQMPVPDVHYGETKFGDYSRPSANIVTPGASGAPPAFQTLAPQTLGPRSEAAPSAAPAVAPGEGGNGPGATPAVMAENAPAAPAEATNPVQKAALQTAHAEASPQDVAQAEEGTAGAGGPTGSPDGSIAANSLRQFAQYGEPPPGSGMTREDWATMNAVKDLNNRKAAEGAAAKKASDLSSKKYEDIIKNSELARSSLNTVHNMQGLLDNPNMHFGLMKGTQDLGSRLVDSWNSSTPGYASHNAPNEIYDKSAASLVLSELKPVLQGTGQVRVAEIELLNAANANRNMSKEANRAILTMTERALNYSNKMGELATLYKQEHGSLDAGFDKLMKQYSEAHPLFTPEEHADYRRMFGLKQEGGSSEKKAEGGFPVPESRHIEELRANPTFRDSFEKHFGPGSADKALGGK